MWTNFNILGKNLDESFIKLYVIRGSLYYE